MSINADIQKLEPGSEVILWVLDARGIGGDLAYFQGLQNGSIWWQGKEYVNWPIEGSGFERTSGQPPTPSLKVGNIDGSITRLCMEYDDLVGATITMKRTFSRYLDARNFPGGNPSANPDEHFQDETWIIERRAAESIDAVEFELVSALDYGGQKLPGRQILANQCPWEQYRGPGCGYNGPPVADALNNPTTDPALDQCSRSLTGCRMRKWPDGQLNFGGFAAADLVRM